jgi:hypothetical protein
MNNRIILLAATCSALAIAGSAFAQSAPPGIYVSSPRTLTNNQSTPLFTDVNGNLKITAASGGIVDLGPYTTPNTLTYYMAAIYNGTAPSSLLPIYGQATTAAPSYGNNTANPLSLDTAGNLRVNVVAGGAGGGAVYGPTAVGSAAANPPVLSGGTANATATGVVQVEKVDISGNQYVVLSTGANAIGSITNTTFTATQATASSLNAAVVGNTAAGGADTGNGVKVSGVYNSSPPTLISGYRGDLQLDSSAFLKVNVAAGTLAVTQSGTWTVQPGNTANTTPWLTKISDGTNSPAIKAASTAAIASDPALTVAISPNNTVAATQSGTWSVRPTDGTNTITVKAASTPAAAGDTSEVVALSPNSNGVTLLSAATGGATQFHINGGTTSASTNSTLVSTGAHTLYSIYAVNATAGSIAYLRLYDTAVAPTCSSATGASWSIPIPYSATGAGVVLNLGAVGMLFANGLGFCVTGGGTDTDNTNALTVAYIGGLYK